MMQAHLLLDRHSGSGPQAATSGHGNPPAGTVDFLTAAASDANHPFCITVAIRYPNFGSVSSVVIWLVIGRTDKQSP